MEFWSFGGLEAAGRGAGAKYANTDYAGPFRGIILAMYQQAATVREVRRVTYAGMAVNVAVAALKGFAGFAFASQALIADAVHSVSDLLTDISVALGVRYWTAPADEEHPYGHGKIEALVTLFISLVLTGVAYELAAHAVRSFGAERHSPPGLPALFCAIVSIFAKEWIFRWTRRVARKVNSQALEANAWHHRSDAISSVPVAIAVALAHFLPSLYWMDAAGALIVSLFIVRVAWEIAHPALQELIDADIEDKAGEVASIAQGVPGVVTVHKVRVRRYGGAFAADLHVHVDAGLSVAEGHDIGHAVSDALTASGIGVTDAVVHIEPARR